MHTSSRWSSAFCLFKYSLSLYDCFSDNFAMIILSLSRILTRIWLGLRACSLSRDRGGSTQSLRLLSMVLRFLSVVMLGFIGWWKASWLETLITFSLWRTTDLDWKWRGCLSRDRGGGTQSLRLISMVPMVVSVVLLGFIGWWKISWLKTFYHVFSVRREKRTTTEWDWKRRGHFCFPRQYLHRGKCLGKNSILWRCLRRFGPNIMLCTIFVCRTLHRWILWQCEQVSVDSTTSK